MNYILLILVDNAISKICTYNHEVYNYNMCTITANRIIYQQFITP